MKMSLDVRRFDFHDFGLAVKQAFTLIMECKIMYEIDLLMKKYENIVVFTKHLRKTCCAVVFL